MNNGIFQQAKRAYTGGDYQSALQLFTQCLQDSESSLSPGETGLLYHQIGNCLMKVHNYDEAIQAYTQASSDAAYRGSGAVTCNLGNCYAALHDFEDAVRSFKKAIADPQYGTSYKAYNGMGKAYLKLGRSAEAGSAFRNAALDDANPNPSPALLNLGICFMALNRPADAVASYESALQFNMSPTTRNKLFANLGQAYTATGQMQKAVDAFEKALADKSYFLNDAASVDYQRAVGSVAQGTAVMKPVETSQPPLPVAPEADMSGLDVPGDGAPVYHETDMATAAQNPYYYADSYGVQDNYSSGEDRFFNATDEELEQWSRGVAKQDRKRRNVGLKILVVIFILLLALLAGGVFMYTQGYGYPTQETVAKELFADKSAASSTIFSSDVSSDKIASMLEPVVEDSSARVDGVDRSMNSSTVYATAMTSSGGQIQYKITMNRSGLGWKISNVEVYFASQN